MAGIFKDAGAVIGGTPLVSLQRFSAENGLKVPLLGKMEYFNPTGSIKDRAAKFILDSAEAAGQLGKGGVVIEATSGNTGIGLACLGAARGYRVILTMPETMSEERRQLLAAYGAELVLTEGAKGMQGSIEKAAELANTIDGAFIPSQFDNPANVDAHYATTGPEIWEDTGGGVDAFVAGVGTGGTITGTGRFLKSKKSGIHIAAVEPEASPVLSGGAPGPHKIQGIGAGFVPKILDTSVYDEVIAITAEDSFSAGRQLARCEGMLVGISSGAALAAAVQLARRAEFEKKQIVVLLPDSGDRYLSTPMFSGG